MTFRVVYLKTVCIYLTLQTFPFHGYSVILQPHFTKYIKELFVNLTGVHALFQLKYEVHKKKHETIEIIITPSIRI